MPNAMLNSVIGNVVATRQRLSAIRQRVGLESQGTQMRELAPSPPGGPANRPGAAQRAVAAEPDFDNFQISPDKQGAMLQQAQEFIDQYGEAQQGLIDKQRQSARPSQPSQPTTQRVSDQKLTRGLAPMAEFFRTNGRLPTPEELRSLTAAKILAEQLGRTPTDTEVELFLAKPPKV